MSCTDDLRFMILDSRMKKHIPMRTCIVTRKKMPKSELMRLVRVGENVIVDPRGKERGRGANITMDVKIFDEAVKKGAIKRALKLKRKLQKDEIGKLRKDFAEAVEEKKFRKGRKRVTIRVKKDQIDGID